MNIIFWRKPVQELQPRILEIPEEKRFQLLGLVDELDDNKKDKKKRRYRLWKFVNDIYPETKVGSWRISTQDATNPKIVEEL